MRYGNVMSGKLSENEERQHSIAQQKKSLPIYGMKNNILRVVRENQVSAHTRTFSIDTLSHVSF